MNEEAGKYISVLKGLEPVFVEAAELALNMQNHVVSYNKRETGNPAGDIVTEADFATQELLLQKIARTKLAHCHLLAEEDTPSTRSFDPSGKYYLSIDPIDDTLIYAKGGEHFSTIAMLHDGKNILYLFVYFPAWKWVHRVVHNVYTTSGDTPNIVLPFEAKKMVVYWSGDPQRSLPSDIYEKLIRMGVSFHPITAVSEGFGTIGSFIANKVGGVYHENMNAYDGLVERTIAQAKGRMTYSAGSNGDINLKEIRERKAGLYYPGIYLALNDTLSAQYRQRAS